MKFKTILSLSAAFCLLLPPVTTQRESDCAPTPQQTLVPLPDLKICTDTVVYNGNTGKIYAAGIFVPHKNQITVFHFTPADTTKALKHWCEAQNNATRVTFRHEFEHARKAHIVQNVNHLTPYQRAQTAIMNETMAPASEIIEAMLYRMETNERFPVNRGCLLKADSMITKCSPYLCNFSFYNPAVADIILRCAIDGFVMQYSRGIYHTKVRTELQAVKRPKYTPHKQCDFFNSILFMPQINEWGALWTFDITTINPHNMAQSAYAPRVNIWNTATESARQYVLQKVDSCIRVEMKPGQMLQKSFFTKTY